jgi:uncharacterized protein YggE
MSLSASIVERRLALVPGLVLVAVLVLTWPGSVQAQAEVADDQLRTVTVSGLGQTSVDPDQAVVRVGVNIRASSAKAVSKRAANRMSAVLDALRELGIDDADLKTTRVSMRPYRERGNGEAVASGWVVNNRVKVTVHDIDQTGDVIDAAVAAGANDLAGVSFRASDPSAAVSEARARAVVAAEAAATELAEAAGVEILGVLSIVEGNAGDARAFRMAMPYAAESAAPVYDTPIEPGSIDIRVTVNSVYQVG